MLNSRFLSGWPRSRFRANDYPAASEGWKERAFGLYPLHEPRFPVESRGFPALHAPSLKKGAHVVLSRAAYRKSGESTGAPSFAFFAKGGIVRSHPLTSHGKQTCSLGDLGFSGTKRLSKGFAHRFRPTYAGANRGHPDGSVGPATASGRGLWYPASREKRARCGIPALGGGDGDQRFSGGFYHYLH